MADPLSISASIAGVITFADIAFTRIMGYVRSVRDADKDIERLAKEINLLGGALYSLSRLAHSLKDEPVDRAFRIDHIEACSNILSEICSKMKKAEEKTLKRRLTWPFSSRRLKEMLAELSGHKSNIDLALSADSMNLLLRCLSNGEETLNNTTEMLAEVKMTREITSRIHKDSERRWVLDSFLACNPQQSYEMSLNLRHPRTGLWLTRLPAFKTWLSNPDSKLWFSGIPGAGKTVLAGVIIQESLARNTEDVATAFFFCDYMDEKTQSPVNIIGALVYQLAIQKEEAYAILEKYYYKLHPSRGLEKAPTVEEIAAILVEIVKQFQHVFLVLDGLDECGKFIDDVLDVLLDVTKDADNISMALLSRDESNIRDHLEDEFISEEIAAHTEDIVEYVTAEIEKRILNKRLRVDNPELKEEILQGLVEGAKGMFRWVSCQLDHLRDCVSDQECRDALKRLPPDLNETYTRILERIPRTKIPIVQMALLFIAYASPRLTIRQLRELLSMPENGNFLEPRAFVREDAISRLCSSLIRKSNDQEYFEFAHFSVREFLESDLVLKPELQGFLLSDVRCNRLLALRCLQYLQLENFNHLPIAGQMEIRYIEERNERYQMYEYSAAHWPIYARNEWANEQIADSAKSLFRTPKTTMFTSWVVQLGYHIRINYFFPCDFAEGTNSASRIREMMDTLIHPDFTPLHMAALLCLPNICTFLLDNGASVNLRSPVGSPMQCAVKSVLFTLPEDISVERTRQCEILENTISMTRVETIKCLFQAGSMCPAVCSHPYCDISFMFNILQKTRLDGRNLLAISALLQGGLHFDGQDLSEFTDVMEQWDSRKTFTRHEETLQLFITSLNSMINKSPLHLGLCICAWKQAVKWRFKFASDPLFVDTRISLQEDSLHTQAIAHIASGNVEALERILADPRVEAPKVVDSECRSLLHIALDARTSSKSLPVVRTLLKAGCSVLKQNREGETPLHIWNWLDKDDEEELVREFVARGMTCTVVGTTGWNVLHCHYISPSILRAFLQCDTKENIEEALKMTNKHGCTPFTEAMHQGYEESALLLLKRTGYDREAWKSPLPVLSLAAGVNMPQVFEALLDLGAVADSDRPGITTPLHHLSINASVEFANRLKPLYPNAYKIYCTAKSPLDAFISNCLSYAEHSPIFNIELIEALSSSEPNIKALEQWRTWIIFGKRSVREARLLRRNEKSADEDIRDVSTSLAACLLRLGFMASYEAISHESGLWPLIGPTKSKHFEDLDDVWPVSGSTICDVIKQTQYWEQIRTSLSAIRLLKGAMLYYDIELITLLLEKGVSIHKRVDGLSPLELACQDLTGLKSTVAGYIFELLLCHADNKLLDDINPTGDGEGLIHRLAMCEAQGAMFALLRKGANPNLLTGSGPRRSAMHILIENNALDIADMLLENGADPTLVDRYGYDAALLAAFCGRVSFLHVLRSYRNDSWQIDWRRNAKYKMYGEYLGGFNALHLSAVNGHVDCLRFYTDSGLVTDLDSKGSELLTPMHLAAIENRVEVIEFLRDHGADVNSRAYDETLPLHFAAMSSHHEAAKILLESGSDLTSDACGKTPLMYAYDRGNKSIIECLRQAQKQDSPPMPPLLHKQELALGLEVAIKTANLDLCEELYHEGCDLDTNMPNCNNTSPLILAIEYEVPKTVRWLLENRACTTEYRWHKGNHTSAFRELIRRTKLNEILPVFLKRYINDGGGVLNESPGWMEMAIKAHNHCGLRLLLKHLKKNAKHYGDMVGVNPMKFMQMAVNQRDEVDWIPLHSAADWGNVKVVNMLLQSGAEIDALDHLQRAPLHIAIASDNVNKSDVVRLLVREGAALECRDLHGHTPLLLAARVGCRDSVDVLLEAKADICALDYVSESYLHLTKGPATFVVLMQFGLDPFIKNTTGIAAIHVAMGQDTFASLLLNSDLRLESSCGGYPGAESSDLPCWLDTKFRLYRRKLGTESFRVFMNHESTVGWSMLCRSAAGGQLNIIENLLSVGAHIDFEGCPSGSALMAACSANRLDSVQLLVRRGASLVYQGQTGFRSAFEAAKNSKQILNWLLVERFLDQRKLESAADVSLSAQNADVSPWSGIIKAELTITGRLERKASESSEEYWIRLMHEKVERRGTVIPQNTARRTSRPSRLIPEELVRIHPEGYEFHNNEEDLATNDTETNHAEE